MRRLLLLPASFICLARHSPLIVMIRREMGPSGLGISALLILCQGLVDDSVDGGEEEERPAMLLWHRGSSRVRDAACWSFEIEHSTGCPGFAAPLPL